MKKKGYILTKEKEKRKNIDKLKQEIKEGKDKEKELQKALNDYNEFLNVYFYSLND